MRNIRLDICYDGTRYNGWQRQTAHDNTIQGKLETALSRILGEPIEISASGRTDTGVHARGQVANFHTNTAMDCGALLGELRKYLPEDIGIYSCREVSPRFHARLNALEKTYQYRLWNSDRPCVFDRRFVAVMEEELDVQLMQEAAQLLLGTHDFSAFCGNAKMKKSTVRTITDINIWREGDEVRFLYKGNGFLYHMVRILTGTLLCVGTGQIPPEKVKDILLSKDREQAGFPAPAKGLFLKEVYYEERG